MKRPELKKGFDYGADEDAIMNFEKIPEFKHIGSTADRDYMGSGNLCYTVCTNRDNMRSGNLCYTILTPTGTIHDVR